MFIFTDVGWDKLNSPFLIIKTSPSSCVKKLEDSIKNFADDILSLSNPSSTHMFIIRILTAKIVDHPDNASSDLSLDFSPIYQPFRWLSFVNQADKHLSPPVAISFNEIKGSSLEKMTIKQFEYSEEKLLFFFKSELERIIMHQKNLVS